MSEIQPESSVQSEPITNKVGGFFNSWKFKLGLVVAGILALFIGYVSFYYPYWISTWGLKGWAAESGAEAIDCMMRDTDNNGYVSCSAKIEQKVFPLECGADIFNIGCRVTKAEIIRD
ncbi:MAG: hypothetical protein SWJ54_14780 [Cyanobacteriota bacterium]|nr:hypothetical protein [Cyanobacteriota bacterium]